MKYNTVLCIPDIQAPYHHPQTLSFLSKLRNVYRPNLVVSLGDELDQYTVSKYAHSPDAMSGGAEYKAAMRLWRQIFELFPEGKGVTSNHVERVSKRAVESGIPQAYLKSIPEFMQSPDGWEWKDRWVIDGIQYEHGERAQGAIGLRNLVLANMRSTVIGHHHEHPGTTFVNNGDKQIWGLNVGSLVNPSSHGLSYTKRNRHKPVAGAGVVLDGVPYFIPLSAMKHL